MYVIRHVVEQTGLEERLKNSSSNNHHNTFLVICPLSSRFKEHGHGPDQCDLIVAGSTIGRVLLPEGPREVDFAVKEGARVSRLIQVCYDGR